MSDANWRDLLSRRFDTADQGLLTAAFSQRLGGVFAALALVAGWSPNAVTLIGLATAIGGCVPFIFGTDALAWIAAAILWQISFALDCADGQLARATKRSSRYGGWLDVYCDHIRQSAIAIAIYAVLSAELSAPVAIVASFVFAAGQSSYLHTASIMNVLSSSHGGSAAPLSPLQRVVRGTLDTPLLLLGLCIARPYPQVLALLAAGIGALLMLRGAAIAARRLRT